MGNHARAPRHHRKLAAVVTGALLLTLMGAMAAPASAEPVGSDAPAATPVPVAPGAGYLDLPFMATVPVVSPDSASIYLRPDPTFETQHVVTAMDVSTRSQRAVASFPGVVQRIVVAPDSSRVFVVSKTHVDDAPYSLSMLDAATLTVMKTRPLATPATIAASPDGRRLVLVQADMVTVLDATTFEVSKEVPLPEADVVTEPHFTPDGLIAFVESVHQVGLVFTYRFSAVDLISGAILRAFDSPQLVPFAWSADSAFVMSRPVPSSGPGPTTFERLDLATGVRTLFVAPKGYAWSGRLSADDSALIVGAPRGVTVIDLSDGSSSFVPLGDDEDVLGLTPVPSTTSVLVRTWRAIFEVDTESLTVSARVPDYSQPVNAPPTAPMSGLSVTPDGSWAFESLVTVQTYGEKGRLGVIDLTTIGWHPAVARLAGDSRYSTAVAASRTAFPDSAPVVYVASGTGFPDALAAGAAAGTQDGPLLLTDPAALPDEVAGEIRRLHPAKIVVVGGTSSVSAQTEASLRTLAGTVTRIAGDDRYATGRAVVDAAFSAGAKHVYVASGQTFPDALSASAAAGAHDEPLVIVNGTASKVDDATKSLLTQLGATSFTVVGGTGTVSAGVATDLATLGTVTRLSGADRYATSVAVNEAAFPDPSAAYLAAGAQFPDALSGGAIAAHAGAPLYVVPQSCVPDAALRHLAASETAAVSLIGGESTLWDQVADLRLC